LQAFLAWFAIDIMPKDIWDKKDERECAIRLFVIAMISILLTAPIGAIGIKLFGPRLLPRAN